MACTAKDIMHPRVSLPAKMAGPEVIEKLMSPYPALPVVDDDLHVIGVVSEYDVLTAIKEGRTIHEFSAESLMTCGHSEHGACDKPITVISTTPIEEIVELFIQRNVSILPVIENGKLAGILSRKNIINALAEKGMLHEHEFQKRV
jgi:CBS domain-containing protein